MFNTQEIQVIDMIQCKETDMLIRTFDDNHHDESFFPSKRSTFSYAPKYYKPSTSFSIAPKQGSVNSNQM